MDDYETVAQKMARVDTRIAVSASRRRRKALIEIRRQLDGLLAASKCLCDSIEIAAREDCHTRYGNPSYEYIENHWRGFARDSHLVAWKQCKAAIAQVERSAQ